MGIEFYYQRNGKARGPVSADELRALEDAGLINMETMAAREGDPQWSTLRQLDIILPASMRPAHHSLRDNKLRSDVSAKKRDPSGGALNLLACFFALPAVGIILLSLINPNVFMDLWGLAVLSIMVALLVAVCAKLVGK